MEKRCDPGKDNRGLTLVELLVTLAVSAVLAGAVAALIGYSINTYNTENVNTEMQYEIQTNVNQIMDAIMSSSGVVIVSAGGNTDYAGFGQFKETRDGVGAVTNVVFTGTVFVAGSNGELYMAKTPAGGKSGDTAADAVEAAAKTVKDAADKKPYLMGRNCKVFKLSMDTDPVTSSCIVSSTQYTNPLAVHVELEFEKDAAGKKVNKRVTDEAIMRNRVTADIYVGGSRFVLKK